MKICILSIVNIKHMTGAAPYTEFFVENNIPFDIIHIDKYSINEMSKASNIYKYKININKDWSRVKKIYKYWGFRKFAINKVIENDYDLIITWGTETALLFQDFLLTKFRNKYIINIRDYANLNNSIKKIMLALLIKKSLFTTISSNGFKKFLPDFNYIRLHSVNTSVINSAAKRESKQSKTDPLRICFIGNVRFYENDVKLLNELGNDPRFTIQYFGVGSDKLKQYAIAQNIKNVEFVEAFDSSQTAELLDRGDVINNLYGHNIISLDTAVSIKYYYSVYLYLPILVFENTHMAEISKGISFVVNDNYTDLGDRIQDWYKKLDFVKFKSICDKKISEIENDNQLFFKSLENNLKMVNHEI